MPNIRIPSRSTQKISIPNTSDLEGNIYYTKNINLNDEGYLQLSSRSVMVQSEKIDSGFKLPVALGRLLNDNFYVGTASGNYLLNMQSDNYTLVADTGTSVPTNTLYSGGGFFNNDWHIADGSFGLWKKDHTTGNWTLKVTGISTGVANSLEQNRWTKSFCIASNNTVINVDTSYAAVSNASPLTLVADLEVTALAFNNTQIGIATKLGNTAFWQSQEAYFCVWDGSTENINEMYSVGSDTILSVVTYLTSYALLTRKGKLLYFNGSGFKELATLPFNFRNYIWSDPVVVKMLGKCMYVEDSKIYINIPTMYNAFGTKGQQYIENSPSGIYCYDPRFGLSHKYSHSNSLAYYIGVTSGGISTSTGTFTTANAIPETGSQIKYVNSSSTVIGGLTINSVYYVTRLTSTTFKLATTYQNALDGVNITITSTGASSNNFLGLAREDYGISLTNGYTGTIVQVATNTNMHDHLLYGSQVIDGTDNATYGVLNFTVSGFENRGYFVTPKFVSTELQDSHKKLWLKYSPLKVGDAIIAKVQTDKISGIPVSSPQATGTTLWTSATTFTTTCDISEAYAWFNLDTANNQLELEVLSGSGAGQMSQITTITLNGSTYTVTVADTIIGASNGKYLNFLINNWKVLYTTEQNASLTSSDTKGWAEYPIASQSKWCKVKVELRGVDTRIEELLLDNEPVAPAL
jgi:hypothetical protein